MTRWRMVIGVLLVTGCSSGAGNDRDSLDTEDEESDTDESDTGEPDTADEAEALYWSVTGMLRVDLGEIAVEDSSLMGRVLAQHNGETELRCTTVLTIMESAATPAPADVGALGWWALTLADDGQCSRWNISDVGIGFEPFDPRLQPAMAAGGLDPDLTSLFAHTLQRSGEPPYLVGVAGTESQFAGTAQETESPPVESDDYTIHPLYLMPLDSP